jgi:hypothetical protein
MKLRCLIANSLWALSCQPARWRQWRAMQNPEQAQKRVLHRLLKNHAGSAFGKQHRFTEIHDVEDFQSSVPLSDYESLHPWIERAKSGEGDMLACGEIRAFELSSGSTSAAKFIPCTAESLSEINEAVRAWMGDLFARHLSLLGGPSWWIVSALKRTQEKTDGGIPIGLDSDLDYLGPWERRLASWIFVEAPALSDLDASLGAVADALIAEPDLRLISVWNPSLLRVLCEQKSVQPMEAWPKLRIISAWADAWAEKDAAIIRLLFPQAILQPKGLLATEGVITIPWGTGEGAVPALNSHFLEFLGDDVRIHLIHELKMGFTYEVILSTSAGLWRYRLGDAVRVVGWEGPTPRLIFVGRADGVCDLRGEKLHPIFVMAALSPFGDGFAMLAPISTLDGYALFTEVLVDASLLDKALCANPHYAHCRRMGQLSQVRVFRIEGDAPDAYLRRCINLGQRVSTVKPTSLQRTPGWENWFKGKWIGGDL